MTITLIGYGTRGDVQPFLTLAWALRQRGHAVRLVAPANLCTWAARTGIETVPLPVDTHALFNAPQGQQMLARGDMRSFFAWLAEVERGYLAGMRRTLVETCADAQLIVTHALTEDRAAVIGRSRAVPVLPMYFFPLPASSAFASPFITTRSLGPLNRLTHHLLSRMLWKSSREDVAGLSRELRQPVPDQPFGVRAQQLSLDVLLAYSPLLHQRPADYGTNNVITGALQMPMELRHALGEQGLPDALQLWLAQGEAPVFLGFGSMPVLDGAHMLQTLRRALERVGRRGVLCAGWSGLEAGSDRRLYVASVLDHDRLLPHCAAAVHHGGSGTTHTSLAAGCPTLVASVFADQPFWGACVRRLGVGETLPFATLNEASLAQGLHAVLRPEVGARARELGRLLRSERGLALAADAVERQLVMRR